MPKVITKKKCTACPLHHKARTIAMPGWGNELASLQIWIDSPAEEADRRGKPRESKNARFIDWLLRRNSISLQDVYVGYTLRCSVPKNYLKKKEEKMECIEQCERKWNLQICKNAKAIVALGELSVLAFTGKQIGKVSGSYLSMVEPWKHRVYADYSPGKALMSPAESVSISGSIWLAAEYVGLQPKINPKELTNFDFEIF